MSIVKLHHNIEGAVQAGIYLLSTDKAHPWYLEIDLIKLEMQSETNDILGQIYGSRHSGLTRILLLPVRNYEWLEQPEQFGLIPSELYPAAELNKIWRQQLTELIKS